MFKKSIKKKIAILCLFVSILFAFSFLASATYVDQILESLPQSWFSAPKTASELGITSFDQSPMLDKAVQEGKIPPVVDRLPNDPAVIEPTYSVGEYGGTYTQFTTDSLSHFSFGNRLAINNFRFFKGGPLGRKVKPDILKGWSLSEDATKLTLYLREGLKWSDGEPFDADDFIYHWNAVLNNKELNPTAPQNYKPVGWKSVEKVDQYTVEVYFEEPFPTVLSSVNNPITRHLTPSPAHHMKQFHPEYGNQEEIEQVVKEAGFDHWYQLYEHITSRSEPGEYPLPTLRPYVFKSRTPNSLLLERNPYFPHVDTKGNQLPYIDKVRAVKVENAEIIRAKAATGEATFAGVGHNFNFVDQLPLFKRKESKEPFRVILWRSPSNTNIYQLNMTHKDSAVREIIQDVKFRRALSMGLDRSEVNETLYYGLGTPSTTTIAFSSEYYDPSYQKYIEYEPDKARQLLTEIGLTNKDNDKWRELPNGKDFKLTVETISMMRPKMNEMVTAQWQELGLNISFKPVDWSLWRTKAVANELDITCWAFDRNLGMVFPGVGSVPFVPYRPMIYFATSWYQWALWNQSDGKRGIEPPAEIKQLINKYEKMLKTMDEQERLRLGKEILSTNAEEVWTIGTLANLPKPVIVNDNLRNVPKKFYHSWVLGNISHNPEVWYFEGGKAATK